MITTRHSSCGSANSSITKRLISMAQSISDRTWRKGNGSRRGYWRSSPSTASFWNNYRARARSLTKCENGQWWVSWNVPWTWSDRLSFTCWRVAVVLSRGRNRAGGYDQSGIRDRGQRNGTIQDILFSHRNHSEEDVCERWSQSVNVQGIPKQNQGLHRCLLLHWRFRRSHGKPGHLADSSRGKI